MSPLVVIVSEVGCLSLASSIHRELQHHIVRSASLYHYLLEILATSIISLLSLLHQSQP
jgi:hypothetical protein